MMTPTERHEKLQFLDLDQAKSIIVHAHALLDTVEIPDAARAPCENPDCMSNLIHRLHGLIDQYKMLQKRVVS